MEVNDNDQVKNEKIIVETTPDKMFGILSFEAPSKGGVVLTQQEIEKAIKDKGIINGLQPDILESVYKDRQYGYKYIIARGTPSVPGEPASLELNLIKIPLIF